MCFLFPSGVISQDCFIVVYCLLSSGFAVSLDWDFQVSLSASEFDSYVCYYWYMVRVEGVMRLSFNVHDSVLPF